MDSLKRLPFLSYENIINTVTNKNDSVNFRYIEVYKYGKVAFLAIHFDTTTALSNGEVLFTLPPAYTPTIHNTNTQWAGNGNNHYALNVETNGNITVNIGIEASKRYLKTFLIFFV